MDTSRERFAELDGLTFIFARRVRFVQGARTRKRAIRLEKLLRRPDTLHDGSFDRSDVRLREDGFQHQRLLTMSNRVRREFSFSRSVLRRGFVLHGGGFRALLRRDRSFLGNFSFFGRGRGCLGLFLR